MKKLWLFLVISIFLYSCDNTINEHIFTPPSQRNLLKTLPYVAECDLNRGSVEINPLQHIWNIKLVFSHRMDTASVEENTGVYVLKGLENGSDVLGEKMPVKKVKWDYDNTVMIYTVQLEWGKRFVLKISKDARDVYGNHLDGRVGMGCRKDDDFKDEPSDFFSPPFEVGGADDVKGLDNGNRTPWGGITFSPFVEEFRVIHFYSYSGYPRDGDFLSMDAVYGKGVVLYPESTSFYVRFNIPSRSKINPSTFSLSLTSSFNDEGIPLLFYDKNSNMWTDVKNLEPFNEIWVKPATYLSPSTIYAFEINFAEDLYHIMFTDGKEDADDVYRIFIASSYDPSAPKIPPSPMLIPWCDDNYLCFAVPLGGLFHYIDESTIPSIYTCGTVFISSNGGIPVQRTAVYNPDNSLIFTSKIKDTMGRPLDTDGDGIEGGIFRTYIRADGIPILEMIDEPNDTFLQAFHLEGTCPSLTSTIPAWDTDYYSFEVETTSTVRIFTKGDEFHYVNTGIRLYSADGNLISQDLDSGGLIPLCSENCDAGITALLEPGIYYIEVYPQYPPIWTELTPPLYSLTVCRE